MKSLEDNCGLFGVFSKRSCSVDIYQGIDFLQHRGQQYCGIATFDGNIRQITHHGRVGVTFTPQELSYLTGTWGIGHVSLWERQPITLHSKLGEIAVAFSGNIINADKLIREMKEQREGIPRQLPYRDHRQYHHEREGHGIRDRGTVPKDRRRLFAGRPLQRRHLRGQGHLRFPAADPRPGPGPLCRRVRIARPAEPGHGHRAGRLPRRNRPDRRQGVPFPEAVEVSSQGALRVRMGLYGQHRFQDRRPLCAGGAKPPR